MNDSMPLITTAKPASATSAIVDLVRYMARTAPRQFGAVSVLMTLASLTEGVSLLLLLPILRLIDPTHPGARITVPTGPAASLLGPSISLTLATVLLSFVIAISMRAVLMRQKDIGTSALLYDLVNQLRNDLFLAVSRARWAFLARLRGSDINHALTADIDRVQMSASAALQLAQTFVVLAVYAGVALFVSPFMTIVAMAIGGLTILVLSPIRRAALRYGSTLTSQRQEQFRIVSEFLSGLKIAKASNTEPLYVAQLSGALHSIRGATLGFMRLYTGGALLFQVGMAFGLALFIWLAVGQFALAYSSIITLVLLFVRIGPRVAAIHGYVQSMLTNVSALTSMLALRDACIDHQEGQIAASVTTPKLLHEVRFEAVAFGYAADTPTILKNVSLTIRVNEITAIVGPSGSGKSTLADILMGLLEPTAGYITIDGEALTLANRRAWRDRLAYVPQDSFLLHDTIAVNLRVGRTDLPDEQLWEALELADAADFVMRLPGKLETVTGDRGIRLSGGERQRIALARALLRKPQLLVLDEATSALDWESQASIARSIQKLKGRTTVVTIAHRPSMIAFADWVVTIDDGHVMSEGPFERMAQEHDTYLSRLLAADR